MMALLLAAQLAAPAQDLRLSSREHSLAIEASDYRVLGLLPVGLLPACVPSQAPGYAYLPTPSPCRVTITDPRTGHPDVLVLRAPCCPEPVEPGGPRLRMFYPNTKGRESREPPALEPYPPWVNRRPNPGKRL